MKRIISLAVICLSIVQLIAQKLPQGIAYQAVAVKDGPYSIAGQNPLAIYWSNKDIHVRFTVYEKYPGGSTQYSEYHATKTDDYGIFNLIIGQGTPISGDFTKIPWDLGTAHLQVEIDFENNWTFKLTSIERFWSVPYAFVTRNNGSISMDSALNALNLKFNYLKNRDKDTVVGNEGGVSYKTLDSLNKVLVAKLAVLKSSDKDTIIGNEWQKLTRNKDTLILSDGGGNITLLDEDPTNELQLLTRTKDTVYLSLNGGKLILNDDDPKNELQDLTINKDTLMITNSKSYVLLPKSSNSSSNSPDSISSSTDLSKLPITRTLWPKAGITQLNGPWTSDAVFGKQKNWTNWDRFNYDSRIDLNFESGDSIIYLSNSNDTLFTYSFNLISRKFSGPVSILKLGGYIPTNDIELLGNVDRQNKCFYWFGDKGLCVYQPLTNKLSSTPITSSNLAFLSKWNPKCTSAPCNGFKVFLNKKINDTIYFFVEDRTDMNCKVYKYEINSDKLTLMHTTKFSMDSIDNNMIAGTGYAKFFHSPDEVIFSASDFGFITDSLVIFSTVETYFNGKFHNAAFVYNFRTNNIRFIETRFHGEIICEHPKLKGVFLMGQRGYKNRRMDNGYKIGSECAWIYGLWNFNNNTILNFKNFNADDSPTFLQITGGIKGNDISYFQYKNNLYQIKILRNTINSKYSDQLYFYTCPF